MIKQKQNWQFLLLQLVTSLGKLPNYIKRNHIRLPFSRILGRSCWFNNKIRLYKPRLPFDFNYLKELENMATEIDLIYPHSNNRSAAIKYNDWGLKKYLEVEFDDAIADYTKAIELDPSFAVAYYNRGTVYYRLGNYETALKDLAKSVDLEPKNPEFLEGLSDCRKMLEEEERGS